MRTAAQQQLRQLDGWLQQLHQQASLQHTHVAAALEGAYQGASADLHARK
jgi:hypothetical protein